MSDDERLRAVDDEVSLPKATVAKLVQELLPPEFSCSKEAKDLMTECCKEFVLTISSEANEMCEKSSKKTIMPEHVLSALNSLGFESFVAEVEDVLGEHKQLAKGEKQKKQKKASGNGMTEAELLAAQEELFAASRARFEAGAAAPEAT